MRNGQSALKRAVADLEESAELGGVTSCLSRMEDAIKVTVTVCPHLTLSSAEKEQRQWPSLRGGPRKQQIRLRVLTVCVGTETVGSDLFFRPQIRNMQRQAASSSSNLSLDRIRALQRNSFFPSASSPSGNMLKRITHKNVEQLR